MRTFPVEQSRLDTEHSFSAWLYGETAKSSSFAPPFSFSRSQDANRCKLLPLRAVVVSVAERAGRDPALVRLGETSESKPSMNGRKCMVDVKTEVSGHLGTSLGGALKPGPSGIRLEGGVIPGQAFVGEWPVCGLYMAFKTWPSNLTLFRP